MGLYRLFSRIVRMIFRDFLFKIPKKYLVVIIVFLLFMLLKTNVFAYSNYDLISVESPATDLVFYKGAYFKPNSSYKYMSTDIIGPFKNGNNIRNNLKLDIKFKRINSNGSGYMFYTDIMQYGDGFDCFLATNSFYMNYAGSSAPTIMTNFSTNNEYRLIVSLLPNYDLTNSLNPYYELHTNDVLTKRTTFTMGNNNFNTNYTNTLKIGASGDVNNAAGDIYYENFKIYQYENDMWVLVYNFYPVKYIDSSGNSLQYLPGYYDSVSENFVYFSNWQFNDNDILSEIPDDIITTTNPYITNNSEIIENWTFSNLEINGGTEIHNTTDNISNNFVLKMEYNDTIQTIPINQYKLVDISADRVDFSIPRDVLLTNNSIVSGRDVTFSLLVNSVNNPYVVYTYNLGTYTFNLTQTEQDNINEDKTQQALDNISQAQQETTNSINNMNNFLQNDNIDNSIVDINAPSVSNSEISNVSDGGFSSIFSVFTNAFGTDTEQTIDIYIPNFVTGGGTKFLTINSNLVRNAISNTSVIPGTNFTILNLVELIWTALFGYWFIVIITSFVNMIYSGSIISDSSLQKLSSTYTGVTGSML